MSEAEPGPYEKIGRFRAEERAKMLDKMSELIEDAQKRAKSRNTLNRDRARWTNLAGKLIWYRDQILRSMNYEALHKEMEELKRMFEKKFGPQAQQGPKRLPSVTAAIDDTPDKSKVNPPSPDKNAQQQTSSESPPNAKNAEKSAPISK